MARFTGCFVALVFVASLSPSCATFAQQANEPEFEMELGSVAPKGSPWAEVLKRLKKHIETGTEGRVKVKLRLGRSNERSLARRTASGTMQAYAGSIGGLSAIARGLNVIEAPYQFESLEEADRVLDDPEVQELVDAILEKRNMVFGMWAENGYRSYFSRRQLRSPQDMENVRFRSQEAIAHVETYEALGATPVTIDAANTMTSLQTGVVDGFDNSALYAIASAWYQAFDDGERYLILSEHCYQPGLVAYSKKWFDTLPKDIQEVLTSIPRELVVWGRQQVRQMEPVLLKNLERYGYRIHRPTPSERAAFRSRVDAVPEQVANQVGPEGRALLSAMKTARSASPAPDR